MNLLSKSLLLTVVVLGFGGGLPTLAAEPQAHAGAAVAIQLPLDHGNKWQTDDILRRGMSEIGLAMAESLHPIHNDSFTPAQYEALAGRVEAQVDYVVGNCTLSERADQQLHFVLEQIIDGSAAMKAGTGRNQGAVKIVQALAKYGEYFDHAGWQPLEP
ncbi:hypothetical protein ABIG06_006866 [Bradyrhizobium sp. USDA 326]|uniref:hypothetical protein n=1 Tax=Bradyrhizobium sp. USDA 326 TaxID=3377726 RepID=UPI003C73CD16